MFLGKQSVTTTIMQPSGTDNVDRWVNDKEASQSYLKDITLDLVGWTYTYTPKTIKENHDRLLLTVSPEYYGLLNKYVVKTQEAVRKENISSVFFPGEWAFDTKNLKVVVKGVLKTFSGERPVLNDKTSILFEYKLTNHKLELIAFSDVTNIRNPFEAAPKDKE